VGVTFTQTITIFSLECQFINKKKKKKKHTCWPVTYQIMKNKHKHKHYIKAFALHNSQRYTDGGRLHLFSDLLFWLPHQINSLNNSRRDCGGGRLLRVGCHVGIEPQAWVCSKDGNVCYVCLLVQYNFSSKVETVLLKCIFLSCWCHFKVLKLFGWLPEKFRKKKRETV